MTVLFLALRWFYNILVALILIRAFGSWFIRNPYGSKWYSLILQLTEPMLAPCRNLISRFFGGRMMMVDFSPVLALLILSFLYRMIYSILYMIVY
ncbi:MAG: YggT family protein [Firmicutes bacterium]|nr:YggT family protein [Clostridiales bacterium]MBQ2846147.1 YggT family protein [Bacillota bacterium]MBQ4339744.1 YggT family protein [Bacillota bacterium]